MNLALKNGFCELSFDEMEMVDGGFSFKQFGKGFLQVAGAVVAAGAMMAAAPAVLAASTTAFVIYGTACIISAGTASAIGGYNVGDSFMN